jgi:uncharacterized membrane protein YkvA (DUF1232 family)
VSAWLWLIVVLGGFALLYALFACVLLVAGRREEARALAGFIPDCVVLCARLVRDPRLPRRYKVMLVALAGYLAMPFDLVPDFIPVAGQLDDAAAVAVTLAYLVRRSGRGVVEELWPGSPRGLRLILALAPA